MMADGKDGLPPRHGIGTDDRMRGFEITANVKMRAAGVRVDLEVVCLCGLGEAWLSIVGCQGFEKAAKGGRDTVVELVSGGPEGVWGCESV